MHLWLYLNKVDREPRNFSHMVRVRRTPLPSEDMSLGLGGRGGQHGDALLLNTEVDVSLGLSGCKGEHGDANVSLGLAGREGEYGDSDLSLGLRSKGGQVAMADEGIESPAAAFDPGKRLTPAELFAKYNGVLDADEVFKLFNECNYTLDDEMAIKLMAELDDGIQEQLNVEHGATLRALDKRVLFKQYDEDGSGAIDAFELASALEERGHDSSPEFVAGLIERHSKSGKTGSELDAEDFGEALAELDAKDGEKIAVAKKMPLGRLTPAKAARRAALERAHLERLEREMSGKSLRDEAVRGAHEYEDAAEGGGERVRYRRWQSTSDVYKRATGYQAERDLFRALDVNGDGELEPTELLAGMSELGIRGPGGGALCITHVHSIVTQSDTSGNGTIDENDFCRLITPLRRRMAEQDAKDDKKTARSANLPTLMQSWWDADVSLGSKVDVNEGEHRKSGGSMSYLEWSAPASTAAAASLSPAAAGKGKHDGNMGDASSSFSLLLFGSSWSSSSAPDDAEAARAAALLKVFNKYDADGGGTIDSFELAFMLRDCGHIDLHAADVKKLFAEVDVDGNGEIDFDEFKQMIATLEAREAEYRKSGGSVSLLGWMLPKGGGASASTAAPPPSLAAAGKGKHDGDTGDVSLSFSLMLFGPASSSSSAPDGAGTARAAALVEAFNKYDVGGGSTINSNELPG